jgi:hypothetical protein
MTKSKRPNKLKCIREFCFECAGDSSKEVTLCTAVGCQLWEYRTGNHTSSSVYKGRMATANKNYPEEVTDIRKDPEIAPFFPAPSCKTSHGGSKDV